MTSDQRGWEDLQVEILANIFNKLNNLWYLMFVVPLVCRSWSSASLDPACWRVIDMRLHAYSVSLDEFSVAIDLIRQKQYCGWYPYEVRILKLLKAVVDRGGQHILHFILSHNTHIPNDILVYICERTPKLKKAVFPALFSSKDGGVDALGKALGYLNDLESIELDGADFGSKGADRLTRIIRCVGNNCKNLKEFVLYGDVGRDQALAIATAIPKLKALDLRFSDLSQPGLSFLLDHCTQLECLDISHCSAVDEAALIYHCSHRPRKRLDQDLINRATSVLDKFHYCYQGPNDLCRICNLVQSTKNSEIWCNIWMLRDVSLTYDTCLKLFLFPSFVPFYIVAVLTGTEQQFYSYLSAFLTRQKNHNTRSCRPR